MKPTLLLLGLGLALTAQASWWGSSNLEPAYDMWSTEQLTTYTDATHRATETLSSMASRVTDTVARTLDDTKDYVYLTWDDNKLREYLESKGAQVKEEAQKKPK